MAQTINPANVGADQLTVLTLELGFAIFEISDQVVVMHTKGEAPRVYYFFLHAGMTPSMAWAHIRAGATYIARAPSWEHPHLVRLALCPIYMIDTTGPFPEAEDTLHAIRARLQRHIDAPEYGQEPRSRHTAELIKDLCELARLV